MEIFPIFHLQLIKDSLFTLNLSAGFLKGSANMKTTLQRSAFNFRMKNMFNHLQISDKEEPLYGSRYLRWWYNYP